MPTDNEFNILAGRVSILENLVSILSEELSRTIVQAPFVKGAVPPTSAAHVAKSTYVYLFADGSTRPCGRGKPPKGAIRILSTDPRAKTEANKVSMTRGGIKASDTDLDFDAADLESEGVGDETDGVGAELPDLEEPSAAEALENEASVTEFLMVAGKGMVKI